LRVSTAFASAGTVAVPFGLPAVNATAGVEGDADGDDEAAAGLLPDGDEVGSTQDGLDDGVAEPQPASRRHRARASLRTSGILRGVRASPHATFPGARKSPR